MQKAADADVVRIDISEVTPLKIMGDVRWTGKAKFPGTPRPRSIVIFQLGEEVVAISAFCPHEHADLSAGRFVEPYVLECPLHHNLYDLRTGAIKTFAVELDGDHMYLLWRRGSNEPVVPQLTQLRVGARSDDERHETLQQELRYLRDAAKAREEHVVTTLKQMESMLREVEEQKKEVEASHTELAKVTEFIKRVTDSMSEVLVVIDTRGKVREVNQRCTSLLGYAREEMVGLQIGALVAADPGAAHWDEQVLAGHRDAEVEACLVRRDGKGIEHLVRVAPLYGPSHKREGAVLVCTDIQNVKAAQRELKATYAKVQNLLDNMRQAVFVVLASGEIIQPVSRHTTQLFGQDVVGKNIFEVLYRDLPEDDQVLSGLKTAFLTTFDAEEFQWDLMADLFPRRVQHRLADGEVAALKVDYCPLRDQRDRMDKLMIVVEDITRLEQLERERRATELRTQILEELAKNRSEDLRDFLQNASAQLRDARHDLERREPAGSIALFRQLHTLKGNARVLGLSLMSRATHEVESLAEPLRAEGGDTPLLRDKIREAIGDLQRQLAEYAGVAERILHVPNELELRGGAELHRAMCAIDAEVPKLVAALNSHQGMALGLQVAAKLQNEVAAACEAADTLASEEVREAARAFKRVVALFTHPATSIEASMVAELHLGVEKLTEAVLSRRLQAPTTLSCSLSTSGWTALYLDTFALIQVALRCQFEEPDLLAIERAAERAIAAAGTLRAEYAAALLALVPGVARDRRSQAELMSLLRELGHYLCLHSTLESLSLLRGRERALLREALARVEEDEQALVRLLESGGVRSGSLVGFLSALRRSGTTLRELWQTLATLFEESRVQQVPRMWLSARDGEAEELTSLLDAVGARTSAIGFDSWGVELGASFTLFAHTPKLGLSYLKRLDILRLTHAMRELVAGNFQLLFDRVQTVEVMAFHFTQLQRQLKDYKADRSPRALDALERSITHMLDVPVIPSLYKYHTMVSEIARRLGKRVALQISGDSMAALPREALYPLHDALGHLIRNAIDHGLEAPEDRVARGKPARGALEIECSQSGEHVKLVLRDDGRGIDPVLLKQRALELGLITPAAAAAMSTQEATELVFLPHFSTAKGVTDISGRGIGMDAVRDSLLRIGAKLALDSHIGRGTSFSILIPRSN